MSINCNFHGRAGSDAEVKESASGKTYARLRVAAGDSDNVQWVSISAFGETVREVARVRKGDPIFIEGRVRLDHWRGKDLIEHYGLSVVATKCERVEKNKPSPPPSSPPPSGSTASTASINDDEIPF